MLTRKYKVAAVLLTLGLLLSVQTGLFSWTPWYTPFGSNYLPAVMYANPNVNDECGNYGAFIRGARSWNRVQNNDFRFAYGGNQNRGAPINDGYQIVIWTNNCDYGVLGVTYLLQNGPNRNCDLLMCLGWNWECGPGNPSYGEYDIESVVCHELGHVLGLGHSNTSQATMYYAISSGDASKRTLHQDDINGLNAIY